MRRLAIVAFALVGALLVASPATATSHLAVASNHTTASDFESATTLDNVVVDGSGLSASVELDNYAEKSEGFEDGDFSGWNIYGSGSPSDDFTIVQSPVQSGSYALRQDVKGSYSGQDGILTTNSAIEPPQPKGDKVVWYMMTADGSSVPSVFWGGDTYPESQQVRLDTSANEIRLLGYSGGEDTATASLTTNEWYRFELVWADDGTMTVEVFDESGAQIATLSVTDTAATKNKFGIAGRFGPDTFYDTLSSSEYVGAPATATYVSQEHNVGNASKGQVDISVKNASAVTTWQYHDGSAWVDAASSTYSTNGTHTLSLPSVSSDRWRVNVTFDTSNAGGHAVGQLHSDAVLFDPNPPSASNLRPTGELTSSSITLKADISDPDFRTAQGDTVTAEFYWNGSKIGEDTLSSNGTASLEYSPKLGGNKTWHVEMTDSYGETSSSATVDVTVPANLRVYYETRPETLVDDASLDLRVQFYPLDDGQVRTRPVENGVVDLSGLPVNNRFVVTVRENASSKFVYRRIVIDNTFETQRLFLLSENVSSSQTVFELQDPTGQFPPEETTLYIEKPIEINNDTQYYVIAGDTFGATGRFPAVLENDVRYRLRLRSDDRERALGSYSAYGSTLESLKVQRIQPSAQSGNAGIVYGSLSQSDSMSSLAVRFRDGTSNTTVEYNVTDGDGNTVVPTTTVTGSSFAHVYEFSETGTQTYNVTYTVTYADGTTITDSFVAGHLGGIADRFGMDAQVLSLMSWVGILATMGLVVIVNADLAPAAGTGIASLLTIIGTVAIPMSVLGMAGAVSVLTIFGGRG